MCGIFTCIYCSESMPPDSLKSEVLLKLKRRGPDYIGDVTLNIASGLSMNMVGTLLHMRGQKPTPQPLRVKCSSSDSENYLLWNGNIFGGKLNIEEHDNDTVVLLDQLIKHPDPSGILSTLSNVHGPWAFVFWQESNKSLWFGRDVFGRRSLLWHLPTSPNDIFSLSSVGHFEHDSMPVGYWEEVPAIGIYQLLIKDSISPGTLVCYPWIQGGVPFQNETGVSEEMSLLANKTCLKIERVNNQLLQVPFPPLNKRLPNTPHICGEEHIASSSMFKKVTTFIETGPHKADADVSLKQVSPVIAQGGLHVDTESPSSTESEDRKDISDIDWAVLCKQLIDVLEKAVHSRVKVAPEVKDRMKMDSKAQDLDLGQTNPSESVAPHKGNEPQLSKGNEPQLSEGANKVECFRESEKMVEGNARIAVLFSGGVDSVVLAALADRCLDPSEEIDLINVAFEQRTQSGSNFEVPDRISALQSLQELNRCRKWNLILVNVTAHEVDVLRRERVSHLVYPLCTVLDDSIGCALWFAARGEGLLFNDSPSPSSLSPSPSPSPSPSYHSRARTLLVGIGADEQLAGYSRHRTKFRSAGWQGLIDEIEMDIKRLAKRNLGRDDRCIADHQREGQFPYLDEEVLTFLQQLPMWYKTDLSLPRGVGEKRLLREAAVLLGCKSASALPKRAIQFGSRMAKLAGTSNSKELGSDVCI